MQFALRGHFYLDSRRSTVLCLLVPLSRSLQRFYLERTLFFTRRKLLGCVFLSRPYPILSNTYQVLLGR